MPGVLSDETTEAFNERGVRGHGGNSDIRRNARALRQRPPLDVKLDQGFRMLRHECDGRDDDRHAIRTGTADFILGAGSDPVERPDAALIADHRIDRRALLAASTSAIALAVRSTCHG